MNHRNREISSPGSIAAQRINLPMEHATEPRHRPTQRAALCLISAGALATMSGCLGGDGYQVRGVVIGVLEPISIRLEHDRGSELLRITEDGPFVFETGLSNHSSYTVSLGTSPCISDDTPGVIESADARVEITCEGIAALSALTVGSVFDLQFRHDQRSYSLTAPRLHDVISGTVTARDSQAVITIAGEQTEGGMGQFEQPLATGNNAIDIEVTHPAGFSLTYHIDVERAAMLDEYIYGKGFVQDANDAFGHSVAVSNDLMVVGAPGASAGNGAAYVFRWIGSSWVLEARIIGSHATEGAAFGHSVAVDRDQVVVGAPGEDAGRGAAYVFWRSSGEWTEKVRLQGAVDDQNAAFGYSVATNLDGMVVVGAPGEDSEVIDSGAAYLFWRDDTWSLAAHLHADAPDTGDSFGHSLATRFFDSIVVGAPGEDSAATDGTGNQLDDSAPDSGAAYLFYDSGEGWYQANYFKASNTGPGDGFGTSVAVSGWEGIVVGAPGEDSAATGVNGNQLDEGATDSGAAYVFDGIVLGQPSYLKASNTGPGDGFGTSVASDGGAILVGAPGEDGGSTGIGGSQSDESAIDSGAAYLFMYTEERWVADDYMKSSNSDAGDGFGGSVASWDQANLIVGARGEDSSATGVNGNSADDSMPGSGAIYMFH